MEGVPLGVALASKPVEKLADRLVQQIAPRDARLSRGGIEFFGERWFSSEAQGLRHTISIRSVYALYTTFVETALRIGGASRPRTTSRTSSDHRGPPRRRAEPWVCVAYDGSIVSGSGMRLAPGPLRQHDSTDDAIGHGSARADKHAY